MRNSDNKEQAYSKANAAEPHNAIQVWKAMGFIYGNAFISNFGEVPNQFWIEDLARILPRDIERGIEQCRRNASPFPPNLGQFLEMCKPPIVEDVYKQERETQLLLERRRSTPKANDDVKKQALAEMKNLLKFKQQPQGS